jgi:hypothetical protein
MKSSGSAVSISKIIRITAHLHPVAR